MPKQTAGRDPLGYPKGRDRGILLAMRTDDGAGMIDRRGFLKSLVGFAAVATAATVLPPVFFDAPVLRTPEEVARANGWNCWVQVENPYPSAHGWFEWRYRIDDGPWHTETHEITGDLIVVGTKAKRMTIDIDYIVATWPREPVSAVA